MPSTFFLTLLTGRQERCDEYETNSGLLASVPLCYRKADQGATVYALVGRRLTCVTFRAETDVRVNQLELTNQQFNEKLREVFGIKLDSPLDIESIAKKDYDD